MVGLSENLYTVYLGNLKGMCIMCYIIYVREGTQRGRLVLTLKCSNSLGSLTMSFKPTALLGDGVIIDWDGTTVLSGEGEWLGIL